jgi:hypothetical protein
MIEDVVQYAITFEAPPATGSDEIARNERFQNGLKKLVETKYSDADC